MRIAVTVPMAKSILSNQLFLAFFLAFLPLAGGAETPTILVYRLTEQARVEVHLQDSKDGGNIQFLLFDSRLKEPMSLDNIAIFKKDASGEAQHHLQYLLPIPDNRPSHLPKWITIDPSASTRRNLKEEGMLIVETKWGYDSPDLLVYPTQRILKRLWPLSYRIREIPRHPDFKDRHYSMAIIENDLAKYASNSNLMISIADSNENGEVRKLGTVATDLYGQFYVLNSEWTDFLSVGRDFQFAPADSTSYKILVDGKKWGELTGGMGYNHRSWPGDSTPAATSSSFFEPPRMDSSRQRSFAQGWQALRLNPGKLTIVQNDGKTTEIDPPLSKIMTDAEVNRIRDIQIATEADIERLLIEPQLEHDMKMVKQVIQNSGIESELKHEKATVFGYQMKMFPTQNQSQQFMLLTMLLEIKNKREARSWIVSLHPEAKRVNGLYSLPKSHQPEDVRLLPFGNLVLNNGTFINLNKVFIRACRRAHR